MSTAVRQAIKPTHAPLLRTATPCRRPKHRNTIPTPSAQSRSLAAPPSTRKPRSVADVFTLARIPQSAFESVIAQNATSFTRLSCAEYYAVAQQFVEAIRRCENPWAVSFSREDGVPAETIHAVGCIMRQIPSKSANAFAMALWSSASEKGHRPSTLSLVRHLIRSGAYGRVPLLRGVEARYRQLVAGGRDADALTAEGELL
ncbi:hypothetical protein E4U42_007666, partial [Claviceps africana]